MVYSVIEIQGKQHKVAPGDSIVVDRLPSKEGEIITLDKVLLHVDGDNIQLGTPFIPNFSLKAKVDSHGKGEKIRVATYKAKSRYRRVKGHRQSQTTLTLVDSGTKPAKTVKSPKPAKPNQAAPKAAAVVAK